MSIWEMLAIAVGLAMDAFAVALIAGTSGHGREVRPAVRISFHFGLFQFLMPVIGWYLGIHVQQYIDSYNRWVAFGLLAFVGGHMIQESFGREPDEMPTDPTRGMRLVTLSIATSIDALAIGLSLAMLKVQIWYPSVIFGVVTMGISLLGVHLGNRLRGSFGKWMERAGGLLLILIGLHILMA